LREDVDRLERVQRRATKRLEGFERIGYGTRIDYGGISSNDIGD